MWELYSVFTDYSEIVMLLLRLTCLGLTAILLLASDDEDCVGIKEDVSDQEGVDPASSTPDFDCLAADKQLRAWALRGIEVHGYFTGKSYCWITKVCVILLFSQPVPLRGGLRQRVGIMWVGVWMGGGGFRCYLLILLQFCQSRGGIISDLCRSQSLVTSHHSWIK